VFLLSYKTRLLSRIALGLTRKARHDELKIEASWFNAQTLHARHRYDRVNPFPTGNHNGSHARR
jgi:hypothetical protein